MPYPNEHSARVREPGNFDSKTFRRKKLPKSEVIVILGKLKGKAKPSDPIIVQAYRFPVKFYTVAQAKKWLKDNKIKYIKFEPAKSASSNYLQTRYLAFRVALEGKVPDTIHLIPFGRWREKRHNFAFDETDAEMILDNFKKSIVDTVIDYEHQTLNAMFNGQSAPAAGWIKELEIRNDGVWCIELEWTKKATDYLQNKEYKYLSPVIEFDAQDRETGKSIGTRLHSCGLTNVPFLEELHPIINKLIGNSEEINKEEIMDLDFAELQEKYDGLVAKNAALEKEKKDAEVKLKDANDKIAAAAVAVAEKEAETIVSKAISDKLIQENQKEWALEMCIKDRKDFDKYLETLKPAKTTKEEAETIVNKAIEDKLILPAQKDWAVNLCIMNKEMLENYLKVCTPHNLIDLKDLNLGQGRVEAYEPEVRK